jgi:hypothetical protein
MPSNRLNTRISMAMPDRLLTTMGKLNVEGFDSYDARTARDIAVFVLEPR